MSFLQKSKMIVNDILYLAKYDLFVVESPMILFYKKRCLSHFLIIATKIIDTFLNFYHWLPYMIFIRLIYIIFWK